MVNEYTTRTDLEMSLGWARENPQLFADAYNKFFAEYRDGWVVSSKARSGFLTLIAERVTEVTGPSEWLRSGSLLYRLTNEPRPQNRDEINVTMAQGSRESEPREQRARQIIGMLERDRDLRRALTWALEWIDAVPEDVQLPAMPGFDRDYVNALLEVK